MAGNATNEKVSKAPLIILGVILVLVIVFVVAVDRKMKQEKIEQNQDPD